MTAFSKVLRGSFNLQTAKPMAAVWHAFILSAPKAEAKIFHSKFCDLALWQKMPRPEVLGSKFLRPAAADNVVAFPKRKVLRLNGF